MVQSNSWAQAAQEPDGAHVAVRLTQASSNTSQPSFSAFVTASGWAGNRQLAVDAG
ncbi:hypothetical protein [Candidatus Amarobacter glycogenicus]|uniref:hypothetical protein n=1 Tax=Candidatus Amarobacter glycogenicus TaxID=3140699 RepID=UPI002A1306CD|nr:hypothetical protein [Dehalococcoidia bacterium]